MKNNKGFMLTELLVVSTFIVGTLIFLFVQFSNINQNYNTSFTYNTTEALYAADNMRMFYKQESYTTIVEHYKKNNLKYLDLSNCPSDLIVETNYCKRLKDILEIKTILFTDENTSYIKNTFTNNVEISEGMKQFIKKTKTNNELLKYRLFIEMNDGDYATIKIY